MSRGALCVWGVWVQFVHVQFVHTLFMKVAMSAGDDGMHIRACPAYGPC